MVKKFREMAGNGGNIMKKYLVGLLMCLASYSYADPLSPEKAFHFIGKVENSSIMIYLTTQPGYRLYKDSIKVINNKSQVKLESIIKPQGKRIYNEFLNKYQEEYIGDVLMEIPFTGKGNIEFDIESQGCTEGLCYSPFTTQIKLKK